jgi:L-threonylcarbamoyladenylate synthase
MEILEFKDPLAKAILDRGDVLALPTETVYGLGVRWDSAPAYEKLVKAKNRRPDKAIAVMVSEDYPLSDSFVITPAIERVIHAFLPGPLTILVKAKDNIPANVTLGTGIAGIRIPGKRNLLDFLAALGYPLQVTSANISGQPSTASFRDVLMTFKGNPDVPGIVLGYCESSIPTTVVDVSGDKPVVVRKGTVTQEAIENAFYGKGGVL